MEHKRFVHLVATTIVICVAVFYIYKNDLVGISSYFKNKMAKDTTTQEPQKTDFGTNVPLDFPIDIPIEDGVKAEQSYSLNYVGQKQLTIVFSSTKTVKENYTIYANFLKKQNWNVSNRYESPKISSLYATKESNEINVTISEKKYGTLTQSQVSISVLKK